MFRDWLPSVIQFLEPYVSSEDIDKGARWLSDISGELDNSSFGILCLTRTNLDAPWLVFEAGALSKSIDKSRVVPFLFGVKRSEIQGPLLQFQSTTFDKEDVKKLIQTLNTAGESAALDEGRLDQIFETWWPQLKEKLSQVEDDDYIGEDETEPVTPPESDSSSEILEEVLELLRRQHRLLNSPAELIPADYLNSVLRFSRRSPDRHPLLRDIAEHLRNFDQMISSFEEGVHVPVEMVQEHWHRLKIPIEFLLETELPTLRRE